MFCNEAGSNRATSTMKQNGPLARYVTLRDAHASGMPGTFSPPPRVSDAGMHHGTCVAHVPWCMPASLTSGFRWSRGGEKRSRHSRRMHNSHFYVSGKRPIVREAFNECICKHFRKIAFWARSHFNAYRIWSWYRHSSTTFWSYKSEK